MNVSKIILGLISILILVAAFAVAQETAPEAIVDNSEKLVVVWTSGDREVAEKMVFMYTYNAKKAGWFEDVTFVIWGPSSKLLSEDEGLQEYVQKMIDVGIKVEACIACARMYGVDGKLKELGYDVKGMGVPLSNYLKEGRKVMTF